jgi:hypothetical protein
LRLLSRKEAKQNGKYLYYTGQPCKHGHIAERYTNNAMCTVCSKKYSAEQVESPETKRARYLRNRDSLLENKKRYYKKNRKEIRTKQKKYREENYDRILEANRQWAKNNPEKARENWNLYRYRKYRAVPAWLTDEDKAKIRDIYNKCKEMTEQTGMQHHVDHIIPINAKKASGLHVPENLQIVPASYNLSKKNAFEAGTLVIQEAE